MSTPAGNGRFTDRVAIVTGGAVGLGLAIASSLGAEGAAVALLDVDQLAADAAASELAKAGHRALGIGCDVSDEASVEAAVARVRSEFGGIDILVNNAAKHLSKYNQPFSKLPRHEIRALFEVNLMGPVNCAIACRPAMAERPASVIINIASVAGHSVTSPYGVSKLAVRGLTTAFAKEFSADGIRVNAVSPGLIDTESAMRDLAPELLRDYVANRQLIHRPGRVEDVVRLVLFLCSDEASFITGETVKVSAGFPLEI